MDFFTQQEKTRKKTGLLVFFFVMAVILIIAAIYAVVMAILIYNKADADPFQPELLLAVAGGVLAIVIGGALYKTSRLRRGGAAVAEMLGARPVAQDTRDLKEKRLLNVVEEMAIASGVTMPDVYVLDEKGINAFAAGWGTADAAVCVTTGCLEFLSRDELQGVIAHEFSHVLNGDMRLNIRLMGIVFGIIVIAQIGYWVLRGSSRGRVRISSGKGKSGSGAAAVFLVALALMVIGYIGVFFGNLILAAVSRAREFLADASAVQFTRNPAGIAGALKKIGGLADGSRINHPSAAQASHMFFANGRTSFFSGMFATHPPLATRIAAIDPAFDGEFPVVNPIAAPVPEKAAAAQVRTGGAKNLRFDPTLLLAAVGAAQPEHMAYASGIAGSIPNTLRLAMMDRNGAQAAVFALLLSRDTAVREAQLAAVNKWAPLVAPRVAALREQVNPLERILYAPIASLAVNSLKTMTEEQYGAFSAALKELILADRRVNLFEYMLQRMVRRTLEPRFSGNARPGHAIGSIGPVAADCATVFSTLAWESVESAPQAGALFSKAAGLFKGTPLQLLPREQCTLASLDRALGRLDRLVPPLKKQLFSGCIAIVSHDGVVTVNEAEYVRAIAEALECPIPPAIASQ
ncbi:MAG: M48 family metallopeptidase [Chitinispirillaceae bacterium]|nr:M48 family metallopeptidase [Chitinispirillaceae bacterium]